MEVIRVKARRIGLEMEVLVFFWGGGGQGGQKKTWVSLIKVLEETKARRTKSWRGPLFTVH